MGSVTKTGLALLACLAASTARARADAQPGPAAGIVAEINRARADPPGYARELRRYRTYYRNGIVWMSGRRVGLRTLEGTAAVDEAIRFLARQAPLPALDQASHLRRAAADHVADQGASGRRGHQGRDGSSPAERIRRHGGGPYGASGEVIAYGPEDAASFVRELIIDDGVPDRGHRILLFSPRFHFAGAACGRHPGWRFMCVADFSDSVPGR
ncbi:MAG TPA: CAP domain-containing protein [Allosphingosinicella sp.]|nr:CAP domain-containing protein [Allosphingosinicella sp.]